MSAAKMKWSQNGFSQFANQHDSRTDFAELSQSKSSPVSFFPVVQNVRCGLHRYALTRFWGRPMRRLTFAAKCVCLILLMSTYSAADVLVSEAFDYDLGSIDSQEGGEGWFDPWLVSEGLFETDFKLDVIEPTSPLIYALPDGGFVNGGDRALRFSNDSEEETLANDTMSLTRGFEDVLDMDEIYFSYLYRYDGDGTETGGFIDDNDFVVWWFNASGGPQMGLKGNGGNGSVPDDFVGRVSGAFAPPQQVYAPGIDISEEAGTLNDTWFLVGKMSRGGHSDAEDDYDQFDLWVNPGVGDADSPHATGTAVAADSLEIEVASIGMRIFSEEPGDAMIWDELRIGETWEDVVSVLGDQNVQVEVPDVPTCEVPANGIAGDLDGDGSVAFSDFLILSANFGGTELSYQEGDIDCSGDVAFADFLVLSANFGQGGGEAASSVPEPTSIVMLGWLVLLLNVRKRRQSTS